MSPFRNLRAPDGSTTYNLHRDYMRHAERRLPDVYYIGGGCYHVAFGVVIRGAIPAMKYVREHYGDGSAGAAL